MVLPLKCNFWCSICVWQNLYFLSSAYLIFILMFDIFHLLYILFCFKIEWHDCYFISNYPMIVVPFVITHPLVQNAIVVIVVSFTPFCSLWITLTYLKRTFSSDFCVDFFWHTVIGYTALFDAAIFCKHNSILFF